MQNPAGQCDSAIHIEGCTHRSKDRIDWVSNAAIPSTNWAVPVRCTCPPGTARLTSSRSPAVVAAVPCQRHPVNYSLIPHVHSLVNLPSCAHQEDYQPCHRVPQSWSVKPRPAAAGAVVAEACCAMLRPAGCLLVVRPDRRYHCCCCDQPPSCRGSIHQGSWTQVPRDPTGCAAAAAVVACCYSSLHSMPCSAQVYQPSSLPSRCI